ncbi:MAG: carboxypeptidase-like regulatory domain-containing protein [Balneolaceae bacterium]|nr:carboxypeptidase-like regulatory domain-containing protein [Balneolaceae bacterium]
MNFPTKSSILTILSFIVLIPINALAQPTGTISGTVITQDDGTPIRDVNVAIRNTRYGTTTDPQGIFRLTGIPAGTYTLTASFIGYEPKQTRISVEKDQTTEVILSLRPFSYRLSGIAVSALRPDLEPETELGDH